jgi:hypothetical protein
MQKRHSSLLIVSLLLLAIAAMVACGPPDVEDVVPTDLTESEPTDEPAEDPTEEPSDDMEGDMGGETTQTADLVIPFEEAWAMSPHNDADDGAFTHWNEDDPAEIPERCAACHSTDGRLDFLGADGSERGVVDAPVEIGQTITCEACHNDVTVSLETVTFPSGATVDVAEDPGGRCMDCHAGRSSTVTVNNSVEEVGLTGDPDTVSEELGFINIHYYAAAATMYGSEVHGGFEYENLRYEPKFEHVAGFDTCTACHDPHTTEIDTATCAECHEGVTEVEDIREIRMQGSLIDYDGDGSIDEPLAEEISGLQEMLYTAIQRYAADVVGTPIVWADGYPYFFVDTNGDGEAQEDEAAFPNAYNAFTPRLLKATYNYQVSKKDPGAFTHNARYTVQLLYDSTADLNEALSEPVDLSSANRANEGHFAATAQSFRHWDEDEPAVVPGRCSKCHTSEGLPLAITEGVAISQEPSNSLACATCHMNFEDYELYVNEQVEFPSGDVVSFSEDEIANNQCLECHQGRESSVSINAAIENAGVGDNEVSEDLRFRNPHYFASGATLFGAEVQGAYQYDGQTYAGQFGHVGNFDTCAECHDVHATTVEAQSCFSCHDDANEDLRQIRLPSGDEPVDFDGDGDVEEGIYGEIETLDELLLEAIFDYAANDIGTPIVYDASSYPYWFTDLNEDGVADPDETNYGNQYANWTPRLLRATYNYKYVGADPGGYAHNPDYVLQVLYDSLQDLGVDVSNFVRPATGQ